MKLFIIVVLLIFIVYVIDIVIREKKQEKINREKKEKNNYETVEFTTNEEYVIYNKKTFLTQYEHYFFNIFKELENEMQVRIHPQINLASIINIEDDRRFHNELFRNIDFAIFNNDYSNLLLLIEINDNSHNDWKRKKRDDKVKELTGYAGYKIMTFYSNYSNEKSYVKNRVVTELTNIYNVMYKVEENNTKNESDDNNNIIVANNEMKNNDIVNKQ